MQRIIGIILTIIGGIGTLMTGIQVAQQSDTFSIFGIDIGVSSANWTPLIICVIILVIGLVMVFSGRKAG